MKKILPFLILALIFTLIPPGGSSASTSVIQLGSDLLFTQFHHLIEDKKVGLLTNQTGINSKGVSTIDMIRRDRDVSLAALFTPETGLNGRETAEEQAAVYTHPVYGIPVYRLSGSSPAVTAEMLEAMDLLLVDLQDTGSRHDPCLSILHAVMTAAQQHGKHVVVLDRPNPLGGQVDGPSTQPPFASPAGLAGLPLAHGMTIGELARYFQREIGGELTVIPMAGYARNMTYLETGLPWVPPAASYRDLNAVLGYMATAIAAGTDLQHADDFSWLGSDGIDAYQFADLLNGSLLPGVVFFPENREMAGGVKLHIIEPRLFNPAKTGMYALAYAAQLSDARFLPADADQAAAFDRAMGSGMIRTLLMQGKSPQELEESYAPQLAAFLASRKPYLIYDETPYYPTQPIHSGGASALSPEQKEPVAVPAVPTAPQPDGQDDAGSQPTQPAEPKQSQPHASPRPAVPAQAVPAVPATQPPAPPTAPPANEAEPDSVQPSPAKTEKVAYLTFDDGPSPVTIQVLDTLKAFDVKATFFVVGRNIPGNEAILQRILAEGHTLGGHSYSHDYRILYATQESFFADLEKGNALIEQATGFTPTIFRYPGGSSNTISLRYQDPVHYNKQHTVMAAIKAESQKRGYTFIDWNVTNGDGRTNKYTAEEALSQIKQQVREQPEIVVLMHDSAPKKPTSESLAAVIQFLQEKGYRLEAIQPDKPTVSTVK